MIMDILEATTFERLAPITSWVFCQYQKVFCGIGTFKIQVDSQEPSLQYLVPNNLIHFEDNVFGIIVYKGYDSEASDIWTIEGYMSTHYLTYRVFEKPYTFEQHDGHYKDMVCFEAIHEMFRTEGTPRYVPNTHIAHRNIKSNSDRPTGDAYAFKVNAGDALEDVIFNHLESLSLGFDILIDSLESSLTFIIWYGRDMTSESTEYPLVEFSTSLGNVINFTYEQDAEKQANCFIAYSDSLGRAVEYAENAQGLSRKEVYLNPDIEGKATEAVIKSSLQQESTDYRLSETFSASIQDNQLYVYGVDYELGDWVQFHDEYLNVVVKVQLTAVTKTIDVDGEKLDFTFGWDKMTALNRYNKRRW